MKINIQKGWFVSAGSKYGWVVKGYDRRGVGIQAGYLNRYAMLDISIENKEYTLDTTEAIKFIKKFRSFFEIKGVTIGVVSKSILMTKQEAKKKNIENKEVEMKKINQLKLF